MIHGIGNTHGTPLGGVSGGIQKGPVVRTDAARGVATSALTTSAGIVADGPPIESDRVAALRQAIRAGSYKADPQAIAARMIEGDL